MGWYQVEVQARAEAVDAVSDCLEAAGALSVTLQEVAGEAPVVEPGPGAAPVWGRTRVVGLFETEAAARAACTALDDHLGGPAAHIVSLPERDWVRAWVDDFHPLAFGDRLWVCPSHCPPPDPDAVNLFLDPGLAFGTGTHPTTALCLTWLAEADLRDAEVLDYGCGSGILAIAAAQLGARRVWAVDHDPQALTATADNAHRNGVAGRITVLAPEALPGVACDAVMANILSGPLIELAPRLTGHVRFGGALTLSGILANQAAAVRIAYQSWFSDLQLRQQGDWVCLTGCRDQEVNKNHGG